MANMAKSPSGGATEPSQPKSEAENAAREAIEVIMQRLQEPQSSIEVKLFALESLKEQLRSSPSSNTKGTSASIPVGLKIMAEYYQLLGSLMTSGLGQEVQLRDSSASILSFLAMIYGNRGDSLNFLASFGNSVEPVIKEWGHEFSKRISLELMELDDVAQVPVSIVDALVRYFLLHHSEPDACDLLVELDLLSRLLELVDAEQDDIGRICLYLQSCVPFEPCPKDRSMLLIVHDLYVKAKNPPLALLISIKLGRMDIVQTHFNEARRTSPSLARQFAFMLARHRLSVECDDASLREILYNGLLSNHYLDLGRQLEIMPPKSPEDIYKSHLVGDKRSNQSTATLLESPKSLLANCYVSGLVNAGFGSDTLLVGSQEQPLDAGKYFSKLKDSSLVSCVASLGALYLWNLDEGLAVLDTYLNDDSPAVHSGALLGIGLLHSGIRNETDPALALIRDGLQSSEWRVRQGAALGLGFSYAGSRRLDVFEELTPLVSDLDFRVCSCACMALGNIFVGSGNGDIASVILQTMMERDGSQLSSPWARMMMLGLGLLYLGKEEEDETGALLPIKESLSSIDQHPTFGQDACVMLTALAYSGSGNVLKVQELLKVVYEFAEKRKAKAAERQDGKEQSTNEEDAGSVGLMFAILGIALIGMGNEDVGQEMTVRLFNDLMMAREPAIRRLVPMALGLLYISNPAVLVVDWLGRISHDHDKPTALSAVLGLGLVSAGTINAKTAQLLRQLSGSTYFQKDAESLLIVRIAQGLTHMGKGALGLNAAKSHRMLLSLVTLANLLTAIMPFTASTALLHEPSAPSFLPLCGFVAAAQPRYLVTLDAETLKSRPVDVRVGTEVDVVGQAGKPRTITGFQTHATPVLLGAKERAEFQSDSDRPFVSVLEDIVLVSSSS
jgi:26S proteasome regulatory subunit N1